MMIVHLLNLALKARNGAAIVALRDRPLLAVPVGDRVLSWRIVDAWCIERPTGGLVGDFPDLRAALTTAWRMTP